MGISKDLKQSYIEAGMVSAILGDHYAEDLYKEVQKRGAGYLYAVRLISEWAYKFQEGTTHIDWEQASDNSFISFKADINTYWRLEGVCWDDYIIEFGKEELKQYKDE